MMLLTYDFKYACAGNELSELGPLCNNYTFGISDNPIYVDIYVGF